MIAAAFDSCYDSCRGLSRSWTPRHWKLRLRSSFGLRHCFVMRAQVARRGGSLVIILASYHLTNSVPSSILMFKTCRQATRCGPGVVRSLASRINFALRRPSPRAHVARTVYHCNRRQTTGQRPLVAPRTFRKKGVVNNK